MRSRPVNKPDAYSQIDYGKVFCAIFQLHVSNLEGYGLWLSFGMWLGFGLGLGLVQGLGLGRVSKGLDSE